MLRHLIVGERLAGFVCSWSTTWSYWNRCDYVGCDFWGFFIGVLFVSHHTLCGVSNFRLFRVLILPLILFIFFWFATFFPGFTLSRFLCCKLSRFLCGKLFWRDYEFR